MLKLMRGLLNAESADQIPNHNIKYIEECPVIVQEGFATGGKACLATWFEAMS